MNATSNDPKVAKKTAKAAAERQVGLQRWRTALTAVGALIALITLLATM